MAQQLPATPTSARSDARYIAILLLLASLLHFFVMARAESPSRDGVGFIRYALQLEQQPWAEVIAHNHQHPLYPISLLAVSLPVRYLLGGITCTTMLLSAQLASALAGILLVVPMYYLGRALFDRRIGFWSAALFQCLPVSARVTADTLSDPLCLLLVALALWLGVEALNRGRAWWFAGSGLCAGLAYLTRPEGLLAVAAVGLVLLGMQLSTAWRRPWRTFAICAASLGLAALLVGGPLVMITGHISTKPSAQAVLLAALPAGPTAGPPLAIWWTGPVASHPPLAWGIWALVSEIGRAFQYLAWAPALLGLVWFRGRFRAQPGGLALLVLSGILGLVLVRMSLLVGYLGERHVQLIVLCGCPWAAAALVALGDRLALRAPRWSGVALMVVVCGFGLPTLVKPLHATHVGYRAAGLWLAEHTRPADEIIDPHNCAYYYAGRVFAEGTPVPPGGDPVRYVVVEAPKPLAVPPGLEGQVQDAVEHGTVVFHCPLDGGRQQELRVYALPASAVIQ